MIRTPALAPAAAALGLLAGLALEARAGTLQGEVSPHTVSVAWMTPGPTHPAGVELDERGVVPPARAGKVPALAPMRARVPARVQAERQARRHVHKEHTARKVLVRGQGCPGHAAQTVEMHRS
jgi:hypothetical protein